MDRIHCFLCLEEGVDTLARSADATPEENVLRVLYSLHRVLWIKPVRASRAAHSSPTRCWFGVEEGLV